MSIKPSSADTPELSQYHNASQYRLDTWNKIKSAAYQIANNNGNNAEYHQLIDKRLRYLQPIEGYWAFPGAAAFQDLVNHLRNREYDILARKTKRIATALVDGEYRRKHIDLDSLNDNPEDHDIEDDLNYTFESARKRPYFEVLIVDGINESQREAQRAKLQTMRREKDPFTYSPVFVDSFEDAMNAIAFNFNIQSVIIRFGFDLYSKRDLPVENKYFTRFVPENIATEDPSEYSVILARMMNKIRPELDLFHVTDQSVEDIAIKVGDTCKRVFYNSEDFMELHLNILRSIDQRFKSPFFTALKTYSSQPTGVFHAMPISRGKSIIKSHWIHDMGEFYGLNIFLAETSSTSGGLDSLLEPHGPIKEAQDLAARAFGAKQTFFATNGTSTCNKIVLQALVRPDEIVLVDRDCHKSHHYGMVLSGANVIYLDSYPLDEYSMYGAVPLRSIKEALLQLKAEGKLHKVKMLLLTNCTFDGIIYNVQRVMEECLAIKPDLVFLWDEAWFAFARFGPTYRQRSAMFSAQSLRERYQSPAYRAAYEAQQAKLASIDENDIDTLLDTQLLPDPDRVRVRVYSTQSTHKTLTALRQGSMIHIHDQDYRSKVEESFKEAFMTHTSTSPNYQILASLDVGRRQVELEGYEMVQKQVEMALALRQSISSHPLLRKYFRVLTVKDMIPEQYRTSGIQNYCDPYFGWNEVWEAWLSDEFCLDPTRVTLYVGETGLDGDTFKNSMLMDQFGIQVNKTARNSVLFMTNIGTTRSSVAYLIEVLVDIAKQIESRLEDLSPAERKLHDKKVRSLVHEYPPLPDFSCFHESFVDTSASSVQEGNIREAFFLSYDTENCEYLGLLNGEIEAAMQSGKPVVAASFIIPYPPGFPVLVPGQVVSKEIISFLKATDVKEIHGYRPELGLRVFTQASLNRKAEPSSDHNPAASE